MQEARDFPGDLDLHALRLLRVLLHTRSVTRTAERMGISQPAASRVVARLREALQDPLLVRTRRGYVLTPRAEELRTALHATLAAAEELFAGQRFDPATSTRKFVVATTDYGAATVMSKAARRIAREAPRTQVDLVPFDGETLRRLETGSVHLALWADDPLPSDFHYRRLFVDDYTCVVRRGHPLALEEPRDALRRLASFPQILLLYPGDHGLFEDDVARRLGLGASHIAVRTPYFTSAPWLLQGTDSVMCIPRRMAACALAGTDLVTLDLAASELRFEYRTIWHERAHRDPGNRWLRDLLREAVASPA